MFKEIRKNLVESSDGFSVEILGRAGIKYKESSEVLFVDSEMLCFPHGYGMVIYKNRMRDMEAPVGEYKSIDDKKRSEIAENIRKAFLFWGLEIEIEESY